MRERVGPAGGDTHEARIERLERIANGLITALHELLVRQDDGDEDPLADRLKALEENLGIVVNRVQMAVDVLAGTPTATGAGRSRTESDDDGIIRARGVELVDANGGKRGGLMFNPDDGIPELWFTDQRKGDIVFHAFSDSDSVDGIVLLNSPDYKRRAALGPDGAEVHAD